MTLIEQDSIEQKHYNNYWKFVLQLFPFNSIKWLSDQSNKYLPTIKRSNLSVSLDASRILKGIKGFMKQNLIFWFDLNISSYIDSKNFFSYVRYILWLKKTDVAGFKTNN